MTDSVSPRGGDREMDSLSSPKKVEAADVRVMNPEIDRLRQQFLVDKGWPERVLLQNRLTFCPNLPPYGVTPPWHPRFQSQLRGRPYRVIPYHDLDGAPLLRHIPLAGQLLPFVRVRLLNYAEQEGKYQSYKGGGVAIYLPRSQRVPSWLDIAADPSQAIWLTEGEDKAIAACEAGAPTIGISGVDCLMWKGSIAEPCGDGRFQWKDRQVIVCFDQDETSTERQPLKPSVKAGAERCAAHLVSVGARPWFVYIACTAVGRANAGKKLGLDDYLKAGGTLDELAATAEDAAQESIDAKLLLRYGMTERGDILDSETGLLLQLSKFQALYRPYFTKDEEGKKAYATKRWEHSKARITIAERGIVLDPSLPSGFVGGDTYNQWRGFDTEPAALPDPEAITAFEQLGARLFNESWPWVRGYFAHLFQSTGEKAMQAVVIASPVQGIAKSLFCEIIHDIIGTRHAAKVQPDKLFHKFATHIRGRVFLYCDELQSDYARHEDTLKDMITAHKWEVEEKGVNMVVVPNRVRIAITTNKPYAVKMDANARRLLVERPSVTDDTKREWQTWVHSTALRLKHDPAWRASVLSYLLATDYAACGYTADGDAPWTIHRAEMAIASDSPREQEARRVFDMLPERFALTPDMRKRDFEGRTDKHIMDQVCALAAYKAETTTRLDGKATAVVVYDKTNPLPVRERERADGGRRLTVDLPADEVRSLVENTRRALEPKWKGR